MAEFFDDYLHLVNDIDNQLYPNNFEKLLVDIKYKVRYMCKIQRQYNANKNIILQKLGPIHMKPKENDKESKNENDEESKNENDDESKNENEDIDINNDAVYNLDIDIYRERFNINDINIDYENIKFDNENNINKDENINNDKENDNTTNDDEKTSENSEENSTHKTPDPFIINNKLIKKCFLNIAKNCHPDKTADKSKNKIFRYAIHSTQNNNIIKVLYLMGESNIKDLNLTYDEMNVIKKYLEEIDVTIGRVKKTVAYVWNHLNESQKNGFISNIRNNN